MPCLVALIAYFTPRLVMILMWLFGDYLGSAYQTRIWPILGFFFMPYTTLAYAWAKHSGGLTGFPLVIFIIAVLLDLAAHGGGARSYRNRRR
ncbi:MAG: hypothetical protein JSR77_14485 [Planctomycetes bacterium]|nr:hypothetical protein [Planctomycetota bacterium]